MRLRRCGEWTDPAAVNHRDAQVKAGARSLGPREGVQRRLCNAACAPHREFRRTHLPSDRDCTMRRRVPAIANTPEARTSGRCATVAPSIRADIAHRRGVCDEHSRAARGIDRSLRSALSSGHHALVAGLEQVWGSMQSWMDFAAHRTAAARSRTVPTTLRWHPRWGSGVRRISRARGIAKRRGVRSRTVRT
jgi:hypothetical protein